MENNKMIQDELMEIAPELAMVLREHPFKIPERYFKNAETNILASIKFNEAENEVPLLENKEHPFKLPANYFYDLPGSILYKIKEVESNSGTINKGVVKFVSKNKWGIAAAASVLLVIMISILRQPAVPFFASNINSDTTYLLLETATALSDEMVVDLYFENLELSDVTLENNEVNYLIEAADLNTEYINSL